MTSVVSENDAASTFTFTYDDVESRETIIAKVILVSEFLSLSREEPKRQHGVNHSTWMATSSGRGAGLVDTSTSVKSPSSRLLPSPQTFTRGKRDLYRSPLLSTILYTQTGRSECCGKCSHSRKKNYFFFNSIVKNDFYIYSRLVDIYYFCAI